MSRARGSGARIESEALVPARPERAPAVVPTTSNSTLSRVVSPRAAVSFRPVLPQTPLLARDPDPAGGGGSGVRERLMSGAYDDKGKYKDDKTGFEDAELDGLLRETASGWGGGIDSAAPPAGDGGGGGGAAKGGDSAGKNVKAHPPWVGAFQSKLIGIRQWGEEDKVAQRLLQVFLREWAGGGAMPASVAAFFTTVGAHENNAVVGKMGLGTTGDQKNWCQQASSAAVAEGLLMNGLRFASPGSAGRDKLGNSRGNEIMLQAAKYVGLLQKKQGMMNAYGAQKAFNTPLTPGDVISFLGSGHPPGMAGHVATIVTGLDAGQEGSFTIVSGNAGGESVRVEELQRRQPPKGFNESSSMRPSQTGEAWIWNIQLASQLNAVVGLQASGQADRLKADMDKFGLESCKPLDEIWPQAENGGSAGGGGFTGGGGSGGGGGTQTTPGGSGGGGGQTTPAGGGGQTTPAGGGGSEPEIEGPGGTTNGSGGGSEPEIEGPGGTVPGGGSGGMWEDWGGGSGSGGGGAGASGGAAEGPGTFEQIGAGVGGALGGGVGAAVGGAIGGAADAVGDFLDDLF